MNKATSTLIAAVATLTLSGGAYAQSNNTLATPTTVSPANATSGYGTPGVTNSEAARPPGRRTRACRCRIARTIARTSLTNAPGSHNTLATPSVVSPAAGQ